MKQNYFYKTAAIFTLFIHVAVCSLAQQLITHTVTAQNRNCNATCSVIDIPELNNNPTAIIFITPLRANGVNLNPHPIGAYYMYLNKWSIFNLDATAITVGSKYIVEYYVNPDPTRFIFVLPSRVHFNDIAYIDNPGLNNNPAANIRVFPHVAPTMGYIWNAQDVKVQYDATASRWFIINQNNTPIASDVAYNIMYSNGTGATNPPNTTGGNCNCIIPASLPPNGAAGGDLGGTYPYPTVQKLQGKPVSGNPPAVGQVLKWNGSAWEPANENATGGSTYNAGTGLAIQGSTIYANNIAPLWNANKLSGNPVVNTTPTTGQVLKWNGTAWEPGPDNVGTPGPSTNNSMQTFFMNTEEMSNQLSNNYDYFFTNQKYSLTITANSRLMISVNFHIHATACFGCQPASTGLSLYINTVFKSSLSQSATSPGGDENGSVSNFMIDIAPGTYIIQFNAYHNNVSNSASANYYIRSSSIIAVPL